MFSINGKIYEVQKAALQAHFTDASYESRHAANCGVYVLGPDYSDRFCWGLECRSRADLERQAHLNVAILGGAVVFSFLL